MALIARKMKKRMRKRPPARRVIIRKSRKYGIDPRAALAVATWEGGVKWGGVGDSGTSYGPFQLHRGGALPRGRGARWANSPAGIDYAIRQMAQSGARGKKGAAAINAIVRNFERPADPDTQVRRSVKAYRQMGPVKAQRKLKRTGPIMRGGRGGGQHRPRRVPIGDVLPPLGEVDFSGLQVRTQPRFTGRIDMPHIDPYLPALPPPPRAAAPGAWPRGRGAVTPPRFQGGARRNPGRGGLRVPKGRRSVWVDPNKRSTHETMGLGGHPAFDYMAPAGTLVRFKEPIKIYRRSGKSPKLGGPPGGAMGYSFYATGLWTGSDYYVTHLGKTAKPGRYKAGAVVGVIASDKWAPNWSDPHAHVGVKRGKGKLRKRKRKRVNI